jgi:hypothetical protein
MEKNRICLLSMGYREMKPGKWGKPIGFHIFTFAEKTLLWDNWFTGAKGNLVLWESKKYEDDQLCFLDWLKTNECYTNTAINMKSLSFEFVTAEQKYSELL